MDKPEGFLIALQIGDSFFPSGAFAYSSGLETFVADGLVADREGLVRFIESYLIGLLARCDLVFVKLAYLSAIEADLEGISRLDHLIHAMKCSRELRLASMQMGRQMLQVMKGLYASSLVQQLGKGLDGRELRGHHPVMFGAVCAAIGVDVESTLLTYVYATVSSLVSAGVRLIPLGHSDGQRAIHDLKQLMTRVTKEAGQLGEADIASFAPALEIRAMRHESLHTRLFKS
jgi:urease accessory protein